MSCSDNWGLDTFDPAAGYNFSLLPNDGTVRIYMLDTGIAATHPEFESRVKPGVNITRPILSPERTNTSDCYGNSHGTHVSGIAAGKTYGAAKRAWLISVKLAPDDCKSSSRNGPANRTGETGIEDFVRALDWIVANHPHGTPGIVSYSSNPPTPSDPKYVEAINRLAQAGILLVESAGNDENDAGLNTFSSSDVPKESVIVVGGLELGNRRWRRTAANDDPNLCMGSIGDCGSNYGAAVDLWAPAQHVVSASNLPQPGNPSVRQGICRLSGTSMAAPQVTGVAASLWARYPNASPSAIKAALLSLAPTGVNLRCSELPAAKQAVCQQSTTRSLHTEFPQTGAPVAGDDRFYTNPGEPILIQKNKLKVGDFDWDNQTLQITGIGNPQHGTLEDFGSTLKYTPGGFTGTDTFTYTIQDTSGGSSTANVWIVVKTLDEPPVAWLDCVTQSGGAWEIMKSKVTENDWDPNGGAVILAELSALPDPQQGTLTEGVLGDRWVFTPAAGFEGTATAKYVILDAALKRAAEGLILFKVGTAGGSCPPELPTSFIANPDSFSTTVNTPFTFLSTDLLANDTPGVVFVSAGQPQHGTLTIAGVAPEGVLYRYEPPAGFTGPDSFSYTIHGNGGVQSSTVATINGLGSSGVVANPDHLFTKVHTPLSVFSGDLTANDTPGVVFIRAENPVHSTLNISGVAPEGTLYQFVPETNFVGTASFEYLISATGNEPYTRGYVTVYVTDDPPVAAFTAICTGLTCTFDSSGSSDDLGIVSRAWSFGDGATASSASPSHPYAARGTYTVALTVADARGQTATATRSVAPDALPFPSFTVSCTGAACSFNAAGSTDDDGIAVYSWSFGDGTIGSGATPSHTYSTGGNRMATLTVTDTAGQSASTIRTVHVDLPPTASFTKSCAGLTCSFNASGSSDDFGIASYAWSFGDATAGSGVTASHTYAARGTYAVVLTVTDTAGQTATASQLVTVDALPVAAFTVNCRGRTCTFDASGSTDDVGISAYSWSFGDGQTGTGVTTSHTYTASGSFAVTLAVADTIGQTATTTHTVSIDLNPTACFTAVRDGLIITFNASCSTDDLGIASYAWSFGDATTGIGQNISHTYAASGSRTVQLTVTDTGGHTATTTQTVNPDAKPVASFTWSCIQRTCSFNGTGSTDNQPIASYTWSFGDDTKGTGATPSRAYVVGGPYNVTLTVTDSVGQTNAKTNAVAVKRPPIAVNDSVSTPPNTAIDINVLANDSDPDNDALTVTGLTTPAHGTVSLNGNGTVRYTPAAGYLGTDTFQYRAQDAQDVSNLATVTVTTNNPPDARDDGWSTYQNGPTNIPFSHMLSNDFDPNGDTVTLASFNTAGLTGTLDCSSGTWCRYTPPSWFVGTTSFTYTASDGKGGTDTATVRIKVAVTNNAPVPQTDTLETTQGVALPFTIFNLLANDTDPDGDVLSVTQITLAPLTKFGTVTCTTPIYNCTYTPAAGFTGVDTVFYRVSDGITFTDGQIRFVVKPPTPAVLDAREDQIFTTTNPIYISYTLLTSNDYDPAGGALTVVSVDTTGLLGTLDCTTYSTGCDYYRGTNDPTRFKYTVRNAQGTLDTTTVTLKPGNQSFNHTPVVANDVMTTTKNVPKSFSIFDVLRNDYDSDNDQLNVSFNFGTPNGHVSCTSPAYFCTYTPNANFTGTDTLTYWANDGTNSASATVTMTVTP